MTPHEPGIDDELTGEDGALADQLVAARLVPAAGFRGALARHLVTQDPGYGPRPRHLRLITSGCLAAGGALLALGALQASGLL